MLIYLKHILSSGCQSSTEKFLHFSKNSQFQKTVNCKNFSKFTGLRLTSCQASQTVSRPMVFFVGVCHGSLARSFGGIQHSLYFSLSFCLPIIAIILALLKIIMTFAINFITLIIAFSNFCTRKCFLLMRSYENL